MIGKDERGYVLSGMGLLLLIPVMIIIPIFLAVESQSSNIPNTMIGSDTVYRTFSDIKTDIRNQIFAFGDQIQNKTFLNTQSDLITVNITNLYNNVQSSRYGSVFNNNVTIVPNYSPSISNWDYINGSAYLDNGIVIYYNNITGLYTGENNEIYCNYTMGVKTDMNITISQENGKNGHSQTYSETYVYYFTVNSGATDNTTAINNLNEFFQNIGNSI